MNKIKSKLIFITTDITMTLTVMDGDYLGNTCSTLEMAYSNARLI